MKYDLKSAIAQVTRNGGKISGKRIIHKSPGLKVLSAIDYLEKHGFYWIKEDFNEALK